MIQIEYSLSSPLEEFNQLSRVIGGTITNNRWTYQNNIGSGYMDFYELDDGLFLYTYESEFQKPVSVTRIPTADSTYFIINYDVSGVSISVNSSETIDDLGEDQFVGIFMASSKTAATFLQPVNKYYRGIKLVIHKDWIKKFLSSESGKESSLIDFILNVEKPVHLFEYAEPQSLELIRYIFDDLKESSFLKVKLLSNSINLLQVFFSRLAKREELLYKKIHFKDLGNIFEARELLTSNLSAVCPSTKELSKIACMSESKFTKMFKQVFGQSHFKYHHSARLKQAKLLLETGKYSVQDVSLLIGYQHIGKFSQAFKKEYNLSPRDVIHRK